MTPATIFPDVRVLINDTDATSYRYTDAVLILKLDDALKRVALLRPDLFTVIADVPCTAGLTMMTVPNKGRIVEVFQVTGGQGVVESSLEIFNSTAPTWRTDTAAPAANWMRHVRNPSIFFIYPQAPGGQSLSCEYTVAPTVAALGDTIILSDTYLPAVKDMLVAVVEWGDDESNLSQRAEAFYKRAVQSLQMNLQTNPMMDAEAGGEPPNASMAV